MIGLEIAALGAVICAPEFLWWLFISRPRRQRIERMQRQNSLFWRIRRLEEDVFGEWRS